MKTTHFTALLLLLSLPCLHAAPDADAPREFARLETLKGTVYEKAKVTGADPDGLRITHASGVAKVKFEDMKDVMISVKWGYNPSEAVDWQREQAAKQELAKGKAEAATAARDRETLKNARTAQGETDERALNALLEKRAVRVQIEAFQNSTIGLIGTVKVGTVAKWTEKPGSMADNVPVWAFAAPESAVLSGFKTATRGTEISRYGFTKDYFAWDGKAWDVGTITYTTALGAERTVRHFTGDKKKAAEFYRGLKK